MYLAILHHTGLFILLTSSIHAQIPVLFKTSRYQAVIECKRFHVMKIVIFCCFFVIDYKIKTTLSEEWFGLRDLCSTIVQFLWPWSVLARFMRNAIPRFHHKSRAFYAKQRGLRNTQTTLWNLSARWHEQPKWMHKAGVIKHFKVKSMEIWPLHTW